jgi:farnesyl-diphosphate farnesyltransferase
MASADLLTSLLRDVSRSFYLTLRVLPGGVRRPIGLAYLLARATDTIADTELLPVERRLEALAELKGRILGQKPEPVRFADLAGAQPGVVGGGLPAERVLLERVEEALAVLETLPPADLARIREVLRTIADGQELDLRRFETHRASEESGESVRALGSMADLDDYTYRVAGCVGEFWTHLCRAHLFPKHDFGDFGQFLADGVRFGKGLQLVNILRDLPRDLRQGRCYVPAEILSSAGLSPVDLLEPSNEARFRPLYDRLLDLAGEHLSAGWSYTTTLPRNQRRVRLACAWPILIGARTLAKLRAEPVLDPTRRIKVSRSDVRAILWGSLWRLPSSTVWNGQFARWSRLD